MMRKKLLLALMALPLIGFGQWSIDTAGQENTINFDLTVDGVNINDYQGGGFNKNPSSNELDADAWAFEAFGVSKGFGANYNGVFNRGVSASPVSQNGFYGFDISFPGQNTNRALGWQASSGNPDVEVRLMVINNTLKDINFINLSYLVSALNSGDQAVEMSVAYSFDDVLYESLNNLTVTSDEAKDNFPLWSYDQRSDIVNFSDGFNVTDSLWAAGDTMYLKFSSTSSSGSGSLDEIAIDNLSLRVFSADYVFTANGVWVPEAPNDTSAFDSDAIIFRSFNDSAVISGDVTGLNSLTIEPGGQLYMPDSTALFITNYVYLQANSTYPYSQMIGNVAIGGGGAPSGNPDAAATFEFVMEQRLDKSGDPMGRWYNMAFPTVSTTPNDIEGVRVVTGSGNETNLYGYSENNGGFSKVLSPTTVLGAEGYQLYAGDGNLFGQGPFLVRSEGSDFRSAAVNYSVTNTNDGFNLLANPFPAILDWEVAVDSFPADVGTTYFIQNGYPDTSGSTIFGYKYYQAGGGTITSATDSLDKVSQFLAPAMSYFLEYSGSSGTSETVTLDRSMLTLRASDQTPRFKTIQDFDLIKLKVIDVQRGWIDESLVRLSSDFADNKNVKEDATKLMNSGISNLFSVTNSNEKLAINSINDQFTSKDVDLHFQGDYAGFYEINMPEITVPNTWTVELEDKLTGNIIDLRKSTYLFQHNTSNDVDRFVLHINKNGVSIAEEDMNQVYSLMQGEELITELGDLKDVSLKVFAVNGTLVAEADDQNGTAVIDASDWAKGTYILKAYKDGQEVHTNKLVK